MQARDDLIREKLWVWPYISVMPLTIFDRLYRDYLWVRMKGVSCGLISDCEVCAYIFFGSLFVLFIIIIIVIAIIMIMMIIIIIIIIITITIIVIIVIIITIIIIIIIIRVLVNRGASPP
jgi:uncharacterized protein (DUF983 family)